MGSVGFYPEEAPVREVQVDPFLIDRHPVTVSDFRRFVDDTGYVTVAERPLDPADYPQADPALLVPGSLVFRATTGPVPLHDPHAWWRYAPGASWRSPDGPGSDLAGRGRHPVTHVAFEDAQAFAAWAAKDLPSEAEWEYAARGGLDGAAFAWGDEMLPNGKPARELLAGRLPVAQRGRERMARNLHGGIVSAERIRALRHDGQRLGVDGRLLLSARRRGQLITGRAGMLCAA